MEAHQETRRANTDFVAEEVGRPATAQIVELTPVPYAGENEPTTVIRKPVSNFMLEKPA